MTGVPDELERPVQLADHLAVEEHVHRVGAAEHRDLHRDLAAHVRVRGRGDDLQLHAAAERSCREQTDQRRAQRTHATV